MARVVTSLEQATTEGGYMSSAPVIRLSERHPKPKTINELILQRAEVIPDQLLIAYPDENSEWVEYTARDLDNFADEVAKKLSHLGLKPREKTSAKSEVVALLGPSSLDYAISMIALSRMGFAVLFLSTRLSTEAYAALMDKTGCEKIVTTEPWSQTVAELQSIRPLESFPLLGRKGYTEITEPRFVREAELVDEPSCVAFIIHSSGSTGFPKPIFQTHSACLGNYALGSGLRAMITTPLFHNSGISTFFRGVTAYQKTAFTNAALPLTNQNLVAAMRAMKPESFHAVPYTLKLLAESEEGIEELIKCKVVIVGGSPTPDDLGDLLVKKGVCLISHYGQTEMGQLMISKRERNDPTWNYLRPLPKVKPYLFFAPLGDNQYECVVLDGLPTKVMSNSDDPPNSYYTRDCFSPHPTIPDAWKFVGRLDDRITLVNGEKVLPVPIENRIRQDEIVHECLVFGVGRAFPGLLVVASESTSSIEREKYLDFLAPSLEAANKSAEKFSQIPREMVEVLPYGTQYPRTDKGTMIRAATYKQFATLIDAVYTRFETPDTDSGGDTRVRLDQEGLIDYLSTLFKEKIKIHCLEPDTDFFSAGMDSLQAIMTRGYLMRQLDLGGQALGNNIAFEYPSIRKLAIFLHSLASGTSFEQGDDISVMRQLVQKYGNFEPFVGGPATPSSDVVLLTGATGSLGAHILSQLIELSHVKHVYCLVRAADSADAMSRVCSSLSSRGLDHIAPPNHAFSKIIALPSDLGQQDLGLSSYILAQLRASVTSVIHCAWPVNFNLSVTSMEPHIRGTRNLIDLCLSVPFYQPARFAFVSSVSAAAAIPVPATVPETYIDDPSHAQPIGYARSKWVAEHICRLAAASTGIDARVLRSGQIVGDSMKGIWNATEAISLMIQSAVTIGALPALNETPSWIPVDICAQAAIELSGTDKPFAKSIDLDGGRDGPDVVYHMQNPRTFFWTEDLLPALRESGLEFEVVSQREWVSRLRHGDQDALKNPAIKLLDFFAEKYDNDKPGRRGLSFDTSRTECRSQAIGSKFDIINSGILRKCIEQWRKRDW
ncbi:hypothetical protein B0I35DRAFT_399895 [Stachybotrys elegans]|uniref:Polyketide synthase-like phosphopantetheine-binding domain-containing protein n=1 Tax=Stachybotrys elegans TaxID=80388 RepID=A0A8K0WLA4_9HYPO|nr:hypothetical protein B0I35DRAFT_399895 [Stachybotrys elegans]